jgi:transposase
MDMRELRGLDIAARCRIEYREGHWIVPSQSGNGTYRVLLAPGGDTCTCEDFSLRREPCKHVHAARLVRERDHGGKSPAFDMDVVSKRPTYKQDWTAYNLAQREEKHRFMKLLRDLCRGISERTERKKGQQPHLRRDAVYAMCLTVYTTFSTRRASCDLLDAYERGYTTKVVPGAKVSDLFQDPQFTPILKDLIVQSSLPLRTAETSFAPDSSGFSVSRFVRWYDEKHGVTRSGKDWVKAHAMCGTKTNVVTALIIEGRDAADCPQFKPLVEKTADNFTVKEVPADKAYLSHDNLELLHNLGGQAFIPFKVNSSEGEPGSVWQKVYHYYNLRREEFLRHYHQRSNAESTFSMVKAKFRDSVRSKTDTAKKNEVFCKFICHNICVVIQSQCELGIEPVFWAGDSADQVEQAPVILPMLHIG